MKRYTIGLITLLLIVGCSKKPEGVYNEEGEKDGKWTTWYEPANWYSSDSEKKSEGVYDNGEKVGEWTYWYENGKKKYEETYKDGKRDGKWTEWREDTWKVVVKHGKWTKEREDGGKKSEGNYKDGKKDGLSTLWYENGQKSQEETYKDGKLDGFTTSYPEKTTTKTEPTQSNCDRRAVREFATETSLLGGGSTEIRSVQSLGNDMWIVVGVYQNNSPVGGLYTMAWTYRIKCNGNKLEVVDVDTEMLH